MTFIVKITYDIQHEYKEILDIQHEYKEMFVASKFIVKATSLLTEHKIISPK